MKWWVKVRGCLTTATDCNKSNLKGFAKIFRKDSTAESLLPSISMQSKQKGESEGGSRKVSGDSDVNAPSSQQAANATVSLEASV